MAILIPSENIYQPKNNKIIENKINNVVVDEKIFNDYETLIGEKKEVILSELKSSTTTSTTEVYNDTNKNIYETKIVAYDVLDGKYYYYQTKLSFNLSDTLIKPSDIYKLKFYNETTSLVRKTITETAFSWETIRSQLYSSTIEEIILELSNGKTVPVNSCYIKELSVVDKTVNITVEAYKNYEGTGTIIAPTSADSYSFQLYGNIYKKDAQVKNYYSGIGDKKFSLNSNELQQSTNNIQNQKLSEHISNGILKDYFNGKETITLTCPIDDYYEYDKTKPNLKGVKIISPNENGTTKMSFENGDIVIPTILDINGKNKAISYYKNDTALLPKEFQVLKHKIIYNGMLFQELQCQEMRYDLVYEINFTLGKYIIGSDKIGATFEIQGAGSIYINDTFYKVVNFTEATNIEIPYEDINLETANFKFLGRFSQISTTDYTQTSGSSVVSSQGKLNSIIQWDKRYTRTFEQQFYYQVFEKEFLLPNHIHTISKNTFCYVESNYLITIPKTVKTIEEIAFRGEGTLTSVRFEHDKNQHIELPKAGSSTGMFYSKNAYNLNIYTDNLIIKNYDWETDNVTPTFYHLDGTLWE